MDAEHRVDGQDGTAGAGPEGGSQAPSRQDGAQSPSGEGQSGAVSVIASADEASPASEGQGAGAAPAPEGQGVEGPPSGQPEGSPQGGEAGERRDEMAASAPEHRTEGEPVEAAPSQAAPEGGTPSDDARQEQTGSQGGGEQASGGSEEQAEPPAKSEAHAQGEHQAVSESQGQDASAPGGGAREDRADDAPEATPAAEQASTEAAPGETAPGLDAPPHGSFWTGESEAAEKAEADEGALDEGDAQPEVLDAPEQRLAGRVTTVLLPLEKLLDDSAFRLRPEGDVSGLATDIARLGQLFPVDVRPAGEDRYQLVCGFRRVAALRFLKRDAVQARIHLRLTDEDALVMSLAEAIHATPVEPEVLEAKRDELEAQGRLSAAVRDMLEKALATEDTLAPEGVEEEIDADELAQEVAQRLGAINQDLSLLADVFAALDEARKAELLMQLRYSSELVTYLEGL